MESQRLAAVHDADMLLRKEPQDLYRGIKKGDAMTTDPPKVNENGLYSVAQAMQLLGLKKDKIYGAIKLGARRGGIDARPRRDNGRLQITGREILRYWRG